MDYCLKLARGEPARPNRPIETDLLALAQRGRARADALYLGATGSGEGGAGPSAGEVSYQTYHPPLFHGLGAVVIKAGSAAGLTLTGCILALRIICVLMALAGRVLVFMTLAHFGRLPALIGLPYLAFLAPVDLFRVSNDSLVTLLGAWVFWLLATGDASRRREPRALLIGLLLLMTVNVKLTAALFLLPAVGIVILALRRTDGTSLRELAFVLLPGCVMFIALVASSWTDASNPAGIGHLRSGAFPEPGGWSLGLLVPSVERWVNWYNLYLANETLVGAGRGSALFPLHHLITLSQVGVMLGLGWLVFVRPDAADGPLMRLRRWTGGALIALLAIQTIFVVLWAVVGRVNWSFRQFALVEMVAILPAAAGWAWLAARPWPMGKVFRPAMWAGAALLFSRSTWPYFQLMRGG